MNRQIRLACMVFLLLFSIAESNATTSDSTSRKFISLVGLDFKPSYLLPTNKFFRGENATQTRMSTALSGQLKYGLKFTPNTYYGKVYPHAIQGIGVAYNTFFNSSEMGNPLALYVFQSSRVAKLSQHLSFDYEWNFGASFGWKPHHEETNPYNKVVGSRTNAYIYLGFLLNWQVAPTVNLKTGIGVTHYSNGNTGYPNAGVNNLGGSISVTRQFGTNSHKSLTPSLVTSGRSNSYFKPFMSYDLIFYGATRTKGLYYGKQSGILLPGSFAIAGMNFNPLYNFSKYFRAGLSLDAQYDESANIADHIVDADMRFDSGAIKFYRPPFIEQFSVGLSVRAEIVMPIFSINLGLGRNFICKGADTDAFYQIFALKADVGKHLFLHIGYQLHQFKEPNNLMIGLGFRFL